MWEIAVTFVLDRVPILVIKTHCPPVLGDRVEIGDTVYVVMERIWRRSYTEQRMLDVGIKPERTTQRGSRKNG